MWRYPTVPKEELPLLGYAKERGIQSVKDIDKDFEDYRENVLFIWGWRK